MVDVLTDNFMELDSYADRVTQIVTPKDYESPLNSRFKARALH